MHQSYPAGHQPAVIYGWPVQEAEEQVVENGVGLAVCSCQQAEDEHTPKCSFAGSSAQPQSLAITCAPGYTLTVGAITMLRWPWTHVSGSACVLVMAD